MKVRAPIGVIACPKCLAPIAVPVYLTVDEEPDRSVEAPGYAVYGVRADVDDTKIWEHVRICQGETKPAEGLCANREDHQPHLVESGSLAPYWCTADQSRREPGRSERRRKE